MPITETYMPPKKHKYLNLDHYADERPRFVIIGIGGSGCNTIRRIYDETNDMLQFGTKGIDLVMANTDHQSLKINSRRVLDNLGIEDDNVITESIEAIKVIQLGEDGLGAGSNVEVGAAAARDSAEQIYIAIEKADIVIIVAGFGGGTGTGASPVIADMAKKMGKVVLGCITQPFHFEGKKKLELAREGLDRFIKAADTTIGLSNQALFSVTNASTSLSQAYYLMDQVVIQLTESLVRMLKHPDLMNLDFADFKKATQQEEGGIGLVGFGLASGTDCDKKAVDMALAAPLFEAINSDISVPRLHGATNILIHVISNGPITLNKLEKIVTSLTNDVHKDAVVKVGVTILDKKNKIQKQDSFVTISEPDEENIKIVFIATGFKQKKFETGKKSDIKYSYEESHHVSPLIDTSTEVSSHSNQLHDKNTSTEFDRSFININNKKNIEKEPINSDTELKKNRFSGSFLDTIKKRFIGED